MMYYYTLFMYLKYKKLFFMLIFLILFNLFIRPTRGNSFLDIILTTHPEQYGEVTTGPPLLCSDHDTVLCQVHSPSVHQHNTVRLERNFLFADYSTIAHELSLFHWYTIFNGFSTVNDYWLQFSEIGNELVDLHVPLRRVRVRKLVLLKRWAWRRW